MRPGIFAGFTLAEEDAEDYPTKAANQDVVIGSGLFQRW